MRHTTDAALLLLTVSVTTRVQTGMKHVFEYTMSDFQFRRYARRVSAGVHTVFYSEVDCNFRVKPRQVRTQ